MERLMHYVWQYRLLPPGDLHTVDGRKVQVIDPGRHNNDAGPDFFNAKVRIGGRLWAGDVELHVRASDWHRHGHHNDPAYDSVVLHVVDTDDTPVSRRGGSEVIPQMTMQCSPQFSERYASLVGRADIDLPCAPEIGSMPAVHLNAWLTSLAYERMWAKSETLLELLEAYTGDWEQAVYVLVARGMGFNINSQPMERLARSMPLPFLRKHSDSLTAVEALLFGQAGLLPPQEACADPYARRLAQEYGFLSRKFSLKPLESPSWKMGRMRPTNLPYRRIATLASFIAGDFRIVSRLLEAESPEQVIELWRTPLSPYWNGRYSFATGPSEGGESPAKAPCMSRSSAIVLTINVAVPLLMAWGTRHGDEAMTARAADWLMQLPPESNSVVNLFGRAGIGARDAFTSQALLQLRRLYCERHSCLTCRLGHRLLSQRAQRSWQGR